LFSLTLYCHSICFWLAWGLSKFVKSGRDYSWFWYDVGDISGSSLSLFQFC